jgi:transcriptional regulator with XRE-family HTH domain
MQQIGVLTALNNRRLDPATFLALQALIARGKLTVGAKLAEAIAKRWAELGRPDKTLAERFAIDEGADVDELAAGDTLTAAALVKLAQALDVDLVWFIEQEPSLLAGSARANPFDIADIAVDARESLELLRAFTAIKDPAARKMVLDLARHFAGTASGDEG